MKKLHDMDQRPVRRSHHPDAQVRVGPGVDMSAPWKYRSPARRWERAARFAGNVALLIILAAMFWIAVTGMADSSGKDMPTDAGTVGPGASWYWYRPSFSGDR
jgi:hypothetical protein